MKIQFNLIFLLTSVLIFSQSGKVGINTDSPQEILHVTGNMRFESSDPANPSAPGKALVSDNSGNASWKTVVIPSSNVIQANYSSSGLTYNTNENPSNAYRYFNVRSLTDNYKYLGTSITLPPGAYIVYMNFNANFRQYDNTASTASTMPKTKGVWLRMSLSETNTGTMVESSDINRGLANLATTGTLISTEVIGPATNGMLSGRFYFNNISGGNKTYYMVIKTQLFAVTQDLTKTGILQNFGVGPDVNPANRMFAVKIN